MKKSQVKFEFIGYGGAFDFEQGNAAAIISHEDFCILLDCGFTVYPCLRELNLVDQLTHVLITHLHFDHVGSLATLLQHRAIFSKYKLKVLFPDEAFRQELYDFLNFGMADPAKSADFVPLADPGFIRSIDTYGKHAAGMRTYAYVFNTAENCIVFSGDLGDADFLMNALKERNINPDVIFMDTAFFQMPKHIYYKSVEKYTDKYKIVGYHNNPADKPTDCKYPMVSDIEEYLKH